MAGDPADEFLAGLDSALRPVAERVISVVRAHIPLDAGIKWRRLTFAIDDDVDHWICAVAASQGRVTLTFHFGSLLDDRPGVFEESDAKFVRTLGFHSADDVDEALIRELLTRLSTPCPASGSSAS
jgi:hypothetical protein